MDEAVEALRRALRKDPGDLIVATRLANALEKVGHFDEAWELLDCRDMKDALAALASRDPRGVLARLRSLDYRRARLMIDRLVAVGHSRHPVLVFLASDSDDGPLRRIASRVIATAEAVAHTPDLMAQLLAYVPEPEDAPERKAAHLNAHGRSTAERIVARAGTAHAVALVPWLIPLLTCGDPQLAASALALVRRMTSRDGPPFDLDLIVRLMTKSNEGEAA